MDEFPSGTNAIVAVLAYTGYAFHIQYHHFFLISLYVMKSFFRYSYDMEDAMILNKSAVDRGMFRGHIYQASYVSLFVTTHCPIYNLMRQVQQNFFHMVYWCNWVQSKACFSSYCLSICRQLFHFSNFSFIIQAMLAALSSSVASQKNSES